MVCDSSREVRLVRADEVCISVYNLLGDEGHVYRETATIARLAWVVGALRPSTSCDPVGAIWLSLGGGGIGRLACLRNCERRRATLLGCG